MLNRAFAFLDLAGGGGGGGAVAVVVGVSHSIVDTAGGGERIVVHVDDSTGITTITAHNADGDAPFGDFAIDDATHVSGVPDGHAAGIVDVIVTNATGDSTTGTGLIEYWSPSQITGIDAYLDSNKGVSSFGPHLTAWLDQSSNARNFEQGVSLSAPTHPASVFGTLPAVRFTPEQWLALAAEVSLPSGASIFFVGKWTSDDTTSSQPGVNPALTVVSSSGGAPAMNVGANGATIAACAYAGAPSWAGFQRSSRLNDGNPRLCGWTYDSSTFNQKAYVGAVQQGSTINRGSYAGQYGAVGAGYLNADGFDGDLGAVIVVSGVISGGDLAKLDVWSSQRFSAVAAPAAFDFASMSGLELYFDAALGVTTAAGKVSAWSDQRSFITDNRYLRQTTPANRPTYNASDAAYNGQPTVEGVAANSTSLTPVGAWLTQIAQPYTLYIVGQVASVGYLVASTEPSFSDGHRISLFDYGVGSLGLDNYPNTNYLIPGGTPSAPGVYCYLVDGAGTSSAFANSLSSAGVSAVFTDTAGWKDLMLFANPLGNYADGKIALIAACNGLHDSATREEISAALGAYFGLTIAP